MDGPPAEPASMVDRLALHDAGPGVFVGRASPPDHHLFGGLVVAQALRAATLTVDREGRAHALHASFVLAGEGAEPIRYEVERTRDGRSFATRRVVARQSRGVVLVLTAGFHADEPGPDYELPVSSSPVPGPEGLAVGRYDSPWFESRDVPVDTASSPPHLRRAWFRARWPLPDDADLHDQALAYLSDHGPTRAVREPHADRPGVDRRMSVSLDHSVWFHRRGRADGWLLSELAPVATGAGRGLALGTIRDQGGVLLATVAQEALLRLPEG
jgi:acyl-CoA thioesterase-2